MILNLNLLPKKENARRYRRWIIFLIPLGVVCGGYIWVHKKPVSAELLTQSRPVIAKTISAQDSQQLVYAKAMKSLAAHQRHLVQLWKMFNGLQNYSACLYQITKTLDTVDFTGQVKSVQGLMEFVKKTHFSANIAEIKVIKLKQIQQGWHFQLRAILTPELDEEAQILFAAADQAFPLQASLIKYLANLSLAHQVQIIKVFFKQASLQLRLSGEWQAITGFLTQLTLQGNPVAIQQFDWLKADFGAHAVLLKLILLKNREFKQLNYLKESTTHLSQDPFCQVQIPTIVL